MSREALRDDDSRILANADSRSSRALDIALENADRYAIAFWYIVAFELSSSKVFFASDALRNFVDARSSLFVSDVRRDISFM